MRVYFVLLEDCKWILCVCVPHGFVNMMSSMSLNLLHITVKSQLHDVCILSFQKRVCIHLDLEFVSFLFNVIFDVCNQVYCSPQFSSVIVRFIIFFRCCCCCF